MRFQQTEIAQVVEGVRMSPSHLSKVTSNPDIRVGFEAEFDLTDNFNVRVNQYIKDLNLPEEHDEQSLTDIAKHPLFGELLNNDVEGFVRNRVETMGHAKFGFDLFGQALTTIAKEGTWGNTVQFPIKNRVESFGKILTRCITEAKDELQKQLISGTDTVHYNPDDSESYAADSLVMIAKALRAGEPLDNETNGNAEGELYYTILRMTEKYILSAINDDTLDKVLRAFIDSDTSAVSHSVEHRRTITSIIFTEVITPNIRYLESAVRFGFRHYFKSSPDDIDAMFMPNTKDSAHESIFMSAVRSAARLMVVNNRPDNLRDNLNEIFTAAVKNTLMNNPINKTGDTAITKDDLGTMYAGGFTLAYTGLGDTISAISRANRNNQKVSDVFRPESKYKILAAIFTEETGYKVMGVAYKYGGTDKVKNGYDGWYIEKDGEGPEVISPPMPIKEALVAMRKMMVFIQKYGSTDASNGFHVSVSCQGKKLADYDIFKLMLFVGDKYLLDMFKRDDNTYTKAQGPNYAEALYSYVTKTSPDMMDGEFDKGMEALFKQSKMFNEVMLQNQNVTDKYRAFNLNKLLENPDAPYIEFRIMGNQGYEDRAEEIATTMLRYAYVIELATDDKAERDEYHKKAYAFWQGLKPYVTAKPLTPANRPMPSMPTFAIMGEYHHAPCVVIPKRHIASLLNAFTRTYKELLSSMADVQAGTSKNVKRPAKNVVLAGLGYMILYFLHRGMKLNSVEKEMFSTYIFYCLQKPGSRISNLGTPPGDLIASVFNSLMDVNGYSTQTHEETEEQLQDENRQHSLLSDIMALDITTDGFGHKDEMVSHLYDMHYWRFDENLNKLFKYLRLEKGHEL